MERKWRNLLVKNVWAAGTEWPVCENAAGYREAENWQTFPELCRMVVLVLQTLSLLTMSLVTSTSASTKLLCFRVMSSSRSVLMVERFLAMILALMAAIFSTDMASDRDLTKARRGVGELKPLGCTLLNTKQPIRSAEAFSPNLVRLHDALFVALQTSSQALLIQPHSFLILKMLEWELWEQRGNCYRFCDSNSFCFRVTCVSFLLTPKWINLCVRRRVALSLTGQHRWNKQLQKVYLNPWFFGFRRHFISCSFDW